MFIGLIASLVIGLPFILIWFYRKKRAEQSVNWPFVAGQVYESRLVPSQTTDGAPSAKVSYSYTVNGKQYQSSRVSYGAGDARIDRILASYPVGAQVKVYYDPKRPKAAVLEPGAAGVNVYLYVGLIVIVVVTILGVFGVRSTPSSDPAEYRRAVDLYNHSQFSAALPVLEGLARKGDNNAKVYLGVMYAKGEGVSTDSVESLKWFILAGSAGEKNAAEIRKGLTAAQQKEAEARAKTWTPGR